MINISTTLNSFIGFYNDYFGNIPLTINGSYSDYKVILDMNGRVIDNKIYFAKNGLNDFNWRDFYNIFGYNQSTHTLGITVKDIDETETSETLYIKWNKHNGDINISTDFESIISNEPFMIPLLFKKPSYVSNLSNGGIYTIMLNNEILANESFTYDSPATFNITRQLLDEKFRENDYNFILIKVVDGNFKASATIKHSKKELGNSSIRVDVDMELKGSSESLQYYSLGDLTYPPIIPIVVSYSGDLKLKYDVLDYRNNIIQTGFINPGYNDFDWLVAYNDFNITSGLSIKIKVYEVTEIDNSPTGVEFITHNFNFNKKPNPISIISPNLGVQTGAFEFGVTVKNSTQNETNLEIFFKGEKLYERNNITLGVDYKFQLTKEIWDSFGKGNHIINVKATDISGVSYSKQVTFEKRNTVPKLTSTFVMPDSITEAPIIPFNIFDLDNDIVDITATFAGYQYNMNGLYNGLYYLDWSSIFNKAPYGRNTLTIKSNDRSGYMGGELTFNINKMDNPITFSNFPDLNLGVSNDGINFNITVNNELNQTTNLQIEINNNLIETKNDIVINAPININIPKSEMDKIPKGSYKLKLTAISGEFSRSIEFTFGITNRVPQITSTIGNNIGNLVSPITIPLNIQDLDNDLVTIKVALNGVTKKTISTNEKTYNYELSEIFNECQLDKNQILTFEPSDSSATGSILYMNFTRVENMISFNTATTDLGVQSTLFDFDITVSNLSNLPTNLEILMDNKPLKNMQNINLGTELTISITNDEFNSLSKGSHTIKLIASDGQNSNYILINFEKANSSPITDLQNQDLGNVNIAPILTFSVTDNDFDDLRVEIYCDSQMVYENTYSSGDTITWDSKVTFDLLSESAHNYTVSISDGVETISRVINFNKIKSAIVYNGPTSLGDVSGINFNYTITNSLNLPTKLRVKYKDQVIKTYTNVELNVEQTVELDSNWFASIPKGSGSLLLEFNDNSSIIMVTVTFSKLNSPPTISGSDKDLGTFSVVPLISYTINDGDRDSVTVTVKIDNEIIENKIVELGTEYLVDVNNRDLTVNLKHTLVIMATDGIATTLRTYHFTIKNTTISVEYNDQIPDVVSRINGIFVNCKDSANDLVKVIVTLNDVEIIEKNIPNGDNYIEITDQMWENVPLGQQSSINFKFQSAVNNTFIEFTEMFTRIQGNLRFKSKTPIETSDLARTGYLHCLGNIPKGCICKVLITNNAFDPIPVWQDISDSFIDNMPFVFENDILFPQPGQLGGIMYDIYIELGQAFSRPEITKLGIYFD